MDNKLQRIKKLVKSKKVDLLLLLSEPNVRYLIDQYKLGCLVAIPNRTEPFIVTTTTEKNRLKKSDFEVFSFSKEFKADVKAENYLQALKKIIKTKKLNIKSLAYEKNILPYQYFENIKKQFKFRLVDVSKELLEIRAIKTPEEIKRLTTAASIASNAMKVLKTNIKPGLTERELASIVEQEMRKKADWYSFETIIASGPNSAFIHHLPTDRKIKKDDLIVADCGIIYKNYCSDITRTLCLKPDKKAKYIYKTVLNAQKSVLEKIKPGIKAKILHSVARKIIEKSGYQLLHSIGHGVGVDIHEEPSISYDSKTTLKPNMIFTVEPGVYVKGFGGVRIEDTVLLTKKGIKNLTKVSKDLI